MDAGSLESGGRGQATSGCLLPLWFCDLQHQERISPPRDWFGVLSAACSQRVPSVCGGNPRRRENPGRESGPLGWYRGPCDVFFLTFHQCFKSCLVSEKLFMLRFPITTANRCHSSIRCTLIEYLLGGNLLCDACEVLSREGGIGSLGWSREEQCFQFNFHLQ